MKYEGYMVGPVLRNIRRNKKLTIDNVAERAGISTSSLKQIEQGGRNLTMKNLYALMEIYETDANSLLSIQKAEDANSIDNKLDKLPDEQRKFLLETFDFMIEQTIQIV